MKGFSFLLSEHAQSDESTIMKKSSYEIPTYLHILRNLKIMYAIFTMMYVWVCVQVSKHNV